MDSILDVVPYGENLAGKVVEASQVVRVLDQLESALEKRSLRWRDVSLLLLANSRTAGTTKIQQDCDQGLLQGLQAFCETREWFPSLIGSTVFSSFFRSPQGQAADISDGILVVAFCSAVFDKIPVAREVTLEDGDRRFAGVRALDKAVLAFRQKLVDAGVEAQGDAPESSIGLIFTTGSGHIEAQKFIDFKDCFSVGQQLLLAADDVDAELVGGCATNRTQQQLQCLYFSEEIGLRTHYRYTYSHGAVLAFLPYTPAKLHLQHPYKHVDVDKLDLDFHSYDQYEDGRYFYVRRINGRPPIEFLADYWDFSVEELNAMVEERTAIPAEPKAHLVTIASSASRVDPNIWPNVPIWLDEIDGEVMLRLVRAEPADSNYFLMELRPEYLRDNARDLMASLRSTYSEDASLLAFLCESRKYVLDSIASNGEADEILSAAPRAGAAVGIYLNGEYSTGSRKSIGYHNYSQIGAMIPRRSIAGLPADVAQAKRTSTLEIFVCHSSRDKATVREFIGYVCETVPGSTRWLDEEQLKTGDILEEAIRHAIGRGDQLFVPFISATSVRSEWVQRELKWALEEEIRQGRTLILPVVLDDVFDELRSLWDDALVDHLDSKLHLRIYDFTESELRNKAAQLGRHMKGWLSLPVVTSVILPKTGSFSTLGQKPKP